uniref:Uncharacterized protein n=1 Tax=Arundo donax TaxID=35708 RepID=A0A0A9C9J6_ARUDO
MEGNGFYTVGGQASAERTKGPRMVRQGVKTASLAETRERQ